jgi:hypothetical protein
LKVFAKNTTGGEQFLKLDEVSQGKVVVEFEPTQEGSLPQSLKLSNFENQ